MATSTQRMMILKLRPAWACTPAAAAAARKLSDVAAADAREQVDARAVAHVSAVRATESGAVRERRRRERRCSPPVGAHMACGLLHGSAALLPSDAMISSRENNENHAPSRSISSRQF